MFPCPGSAYALKVGWMHCMIPVEGVPAAALLSQPLTAEGSPPDSCWMTIQMSCGLSLDAGIPCASRILVAWLIQPLTWCGGAGPPVAGGPLMRTPPTVCALPPGETGRPSSEPAEADGSETAHGGGAGPGPAGPGGPPPTRGAGAGPPPG